MRVVVFVLLLILYLLFATFHWLLKTLFHVNFISPQVFFGYTIGFFATLVIIRLITTLIAKKTRPSGWVFGFTLFAAFLCFTTSLLSSPINFIVGAALVVASCMRGAKRKGSHREKTNKLSPDRTMNEDKAYEILKVTPGSRPELIKDVYRQLAHIYHPDKSKDPNAGKIFVKIKNAYEYLEQNIFHR